MYGHRSSNSDYLNSMTLCRQCSERYNLGSCQYTKSEQASVLTKGGGGFPKVRQIATDKALTAVKCGKQTQPSAHSTIAGSKWKPGDVAHDERLNNLASENTKDTGFTCLVLERVSRVTEERHVQKRTHKRLPTSYCKRKSCLPWLEIKVGDKSNTETPTMLQGAIPPPQATEAPCFGAGTPPAPPNLPAVASNPTQALLCQHRQKPKHPQQKGNSVNGACPSSLSITVLHPLLCVSLFLEIRCHSVAHYQTLKLTMYPKQVSNSRQLFHI